MATATYTCTTFNNQPKQVHIGVNSVSGTIMATATSTVGDVFFLAKIPHGAKFVSIEADHSTSGAATQVLEYGLTTGGPNGSATFSAFIASGNQATINRRNVLGLPADVSVSDLSPDRFGILSARVVSGTTTTSLVVNFVFNYRMD